MKKTQYLILIQVTAIFIALFPLYLRADETTGLWPEVADLMNSRNYKGVIEKLNSYAKESTQPDQKAWIYYQIGYVYFGYVHDYDQAISAFRKVLSIKESVKNSPQGLDDCAVLSQMSIADVYRSIGKYDKAIEEYQKIIKDYSGTGYAKIASDDVKGISDALAEIEFYNKVINEHPNTEISAEIQFEIAELYLSSQNLNNPDQAIKEYTKVVEKYPNSPKSAEALFKIADTYRAILHLPYKAISSYQNVLGNKFSANNLGAEAIFQIGMIYYSDLYDYTKASETFNRFLNDYPTYWKFPAGVYWQGMCYEQLKDYDEAIKAFELFIQLYPDEESKLSADIGRLGERNVKLRIRAKIDEISKLAPKALWDEAEKLSSLGKYREALTTYRELMESYPDTDYAKNAKDKAGKIEIMADIQIWQEKKTDADPFAQYKIAEIYDSEMHDYPRAIKEYEAVYADYPKTYWAGEALFKMGVIYSGYIPSKGKIDKNIRKLLKPDYNKAIEKYNQLIREYPETYRSAEAHYLIGEIYRIHLNNYDKALEEYKKVLNNYPRKTFHEREGYKDSLADQAQFKIGRVYYENLKNNEMALDTFTKFLNDYPDSCRKAAAYSFILAIQEDQKDYESATKSTNKIIDIIVDSNVQSLYYVRDSVLGVRQLELGATGSDLQRDIIKQLRQKVTQLQSLNAQVPAKQKND